MASVLEQGSELAALTVRSIAPALFRINASQGPWIEACCTTLKSALFCAQAEVDAAIAKLKELKVDAAAKQEVSGIVRKS